MSRYYELQRSLNHSFPTHVHSCYSMYIDFDSARVSEWEGSQCHECPAGLQAAGAEGPQRLDLGVPGR